MVKIKFHDLPGHWKAFCMFLLLVCLPLSALTWSTLVVCLCERAGEVMNIVENFLQFSS